MRIVSEAGVQRLDFRGGDCAHWAIALMAANLAGSPRLYDLPVSETSPGARRERVRRRLTAGLRLHHARPLAAAGGRAIDAGEENPLQHLPFDRLLQDRYVAEPVVDSIGLVAGEENERNAARREYFGHRIGHAVAEVDVEDGTVEIALPRGRKRFGSGADRADDGAAALAEKLLDHHGDQSLVLDQEDAAAIRHVRPDGAAIGAGTCLFGFAAANRFALRDR